MDDITRSSREDLPIDDPAYFSKGESEADGPFASSTPGNLSRNQSYSGSSSFQDQEDLDALPPLERLTIFDFLENLALPQRFERLQHSISSQTEKVRRGQEDARKRVVEEWRKRVPPPDEQLDRYRKRMRSSVDRLGRRWSDVKAVTSREKVAFIAGVLNIFISGYLIGAFPQYFHLWYTAQVLYFYPVRFYTYHRRGYHYFLVDLCYFVNLLLLLSIWVAPRSKRLFISTFCLAFGNNAIAIAMWRNSLVFHSLDKVTSLFIHIMPCVTLHCMIHLTPASLQKTRFPAIYNIKYSSPTSPEHYSLASMIVWATLPYAMWQITYHFLISVRRAEKIAGGRPTSFTWLRKSYANTWLGKIVLSQPEQWQEPTFMLIQYLYALLTMLPAPIWFWFRWPSAGFLLVVFTWSVYNGAVYYIDVFGKRFQRELDQLKADVAKWQASPEIAAKTPQMTPNASTDGGGAQGSAQSNQLTQLSLGAAATEDGTLGGSATRDEGNTSEKRASSSSEDFSLVDKNSTSYASSSTGIDQTQEGSAGIRARNQADS